MKVIRTLPKRKQNGLDWSECTNPTEMEEEEFKKLQASDPSWIPYYDIWEQPLTILSEFSGCEMVRCTPTAAGDTLALGEADKIYILLRATKFHMLLRVEDVTKEEDVAPKTLLLDARYTAPEDWIPCYTGGWL